MGGEGQRQDRDREDDADNGDDAAAIAMSTWRPASALPVRNQKGRVRLVVGREVDLERDAEECKHNDDHDAGDQPESRSAAPRHATRAVAALATPPGSCGAARSRARGRRCRSQGLHAIVSLPTSLPGSPDELPERSWPKRVRRLWASSVTSVKPDLRYNSSTGRWVMIATVLGSGMASMNTTVVGIALPTIGREFHASFGGLQWVVNGYTLALATLLLVGGSLGDHYGRRRIFTIGVAWFTVAWAASALRTGHCGARRVADPPGSGGHVAHGREGGHPPGLLRQGRPSTGDRSLDRARRRRPAIGPFLGGYLIAAASWRWIFLINVPLGTAVLLISSRHVPESRDPQARGRIDLEGAVLGFLALGGITFGLVSGPSLGWARPGVLLAILGGAVAAGTFVTVRLRSSDSDAASGLVKKGDSSA